MLIDPEAHGTITAVLTPEELPQWATDLQVFKGVGETLAGFTSSNDCIGQVVVRGRSLEECRRRAEELGAGIRLETGGTSEVARA